MLWKRKAGKRAVKPSGLTAFIDQGAEIDGKSTFTGTVMLNGTIRGEVTSSDTVIIGEKGIVQAEVHAAAVIVSGHVMGNVVATQRLELHGGARVFGDIEAPVVVIEAGAVFEGQCRMTPTASAEVGAPAVPDEVGAPAMPEQHDLSVAR